MQDGGKVVVMTAQYISTEPPAIRKESDVIAYALTTLGYWPKNSLVFVIAPQGMVGPVLRIDLDLFKPEHAADVPDVLAHTLERSPGLLKNTTQIFALFFGETKHPRTAHLDNPLHILDLDQTAAERTAPFVQEIHQYAEEHHIKCADALFIGEGTYWGVLYPAYQNVLVGSNTEILESPLNVYMIAEGQSIDEDLDAHLDSTHWNPLENTVENRDWFKETDRWYRAYQGKNEVTEKTSHTEYRHIIQSQLAFWDFALKATRDQMADARRKAMRRWGFFDSRAHLAPQRIQNAIPQQLAGYLTASMTDPSFVHHLLYLGMTNLQKTTTVVNSFHVLSELLEPQHEGDEPSSVVLPLGIRHREINHLCQQMLNADYFEQKIITKQSAMRNIDKLARTISGNSDTKPSWAIVDALEILCLLLLEKATGPEKYNLLTTLAWINWLKGKSSAAAQIMERAEREESLAAPLLLTALTNNALPQVALTPENSWVTYNHKLNNPAKT